MGFYYGGKYYCGNKSYKYVNRKAKKELKKTEESLNMLMGMLLAPIAIPFLIICKIFGIGKKKAKR